MSNETYALKRASHLNEIALFGLITWLNPWSIIDQKQTPKARNKFLSENQHVGEQNYNELQQKCTDRGHILCMEDVVIMGSVGCGEDVEDVVSVVSVEDVAESGGHG